MEKGQTLAHYTILRPLGKGGMGEVYLAEDTRLKRDVALKVLPEMVRNDPERLRRFRTEAEAAATLNHPHIATIHSIEEADGQVFIVMEHVDGLPLSERIPNSGLDTHQFLDWFIPLADALSHAHDHGRIHRDLKPANLMIRQDGTPKILDFGLARIVEPAQDVVASDSAHTVDADAPTITMTAEEQGMANMTQKRPFRSAIDSLSL